MAFRISILKHLPIKALPAYSKLKLYAQNRYTFGQMHRETVLIHVQFVCVWNCLHFITWLVIKQNKNETLWWKLVWARKKRRKLNFPSGSVCTCFDETPPLFLLLFHSLHAPSVIPLPFSTSFWLQCPGFA